MLRSALFALVLLAAPAARADDGGASLTIEIGNLAPQGAVLLQLFDSEAGYDSGEGVGARRVVVDSDSATVSFEGLAPGQYAFRLFHDLDSDGEMDTNPFGIPTEPFAFSNNARGRFGPASWADAAFTVSAGENVQRVEAGGAF